VRDEVHGRGSIAQLDEQVWDLDVMNKTPHCRPFSTDNVRNPLFTNPQAPL
jgi:hypothetical protein